MSRRKQAKPQHLDSKQRRLARQGAAPAPQVAEEPASEADDEVPRPACPSAENDDAEKAPPTARASESREQTATLGERTFNCCYPGCHFKTVHGMKDLDRHLRIHTARIGCFGLIRKTGVSLLLNVQLTGDAFPLKV